MKHILVYNDIENEILIEFHSENTLLDQFEEV